MLGKKKEAQNATPQKIEYKSLNDEELIKLCAQKDQEAFSEIVAKYEKFVYSAVFAELKNTDDAFDASQEVFIRLYNAADGFRGESSLKTWLWRMCKNCAYDYMRKHYKNREFSLTKPNEEDETCDNVEIADQTTPEEELLRKEKIKAVRNAITKLSSEQREVIVMRELWEMPYSEIAQILGISEGTVKSRISRGRENLKNLLENFK